MPKETLEEIIREQVVNDYFTPNIKAEVILDTLLTPYIPQILKDQLGINAEPLAKEMSIPEEGKFGSIGTKIDYVLADSDNVYLVELKTTDSSIDNDQAGKYLSNCQNKRFGETLGWQLLSILDKPLKGTFNLHLKEYCEQTGDPSSWDDAQGDEVLRQVFQKIITKSFALFRLPVDKINQKCRCAENARELIFENNWTQREKYRSRKYLFTLGQLVNYLNKGNHLWTKHLRLVYITPYGKPPHRNLLAATGFYLWPKDNEKNGSISLQEAIQKLNPENGNKEYVQLLKSIAEDILHEEN